jgi:glycosyltransferase involved in cell wall biosynthesis
MEPNPLVSIVIPTYNRATYIFKTIQTLLNQTYNNFEILVIDDGSTDNTEEVLKQIQDPRVTYFKKNNAERGAARNYGAKLAKGAYINFFDSDDVAYPNHVETAYNSIEALNNPEVFHLGYDVKDAEGVLIRNAGTWPSSINKRLIDGNHLSCNGVFIRKDIALQFPFSEIRELSASEDYVLWLRLASRFTIHCISAITSTVVNHEFRSVLTINRDGLVKRMKIMEEVLSGDDAFMNKYGADFSKFLAYRDLYIALHLRLANYKKEETLRYMMSAAKQYPFSILSKRFLVLVKKIIL